MNTVPFEFESKIVRTIVDANGDVWFVAKDVAVALGYKSPADAVSSFCKKAKSLKDIPLGDSPKAEMAEHPSDLHFHRHVRVDLRDVYHTPVEYRSRKLALTVQAGLARELHGQDWNAKQGQGLGE